MADSKEILSVVVCGSSSKLSDFAMGDKQLIFLEDKHVIALDYKHKRTFFNQIEVVETDNDRLKLTPNKNQFYFVIGTAVLWTYNGTEWIAITTPPQDFLFIGTELPSIGSENTLYVDKKEQSISVWDDENKEYLVVSDKTKFVTDDMINALF